MTQGDFGSLIGVYTGPALEGLTEVARSDGSGIVSFRAVAGATYQIAVDASYGRLGDFALALKLFPAVENDQLADALNLSGSTIVVRGSNVGASKEPGEPDHAFGTAAHSVWWNWTAPFTGGAELSVDQSDFSIRLGIYTGSAVSIADACGCTRSGQFGSHSQSGLPQRLQKCRRAELRLTRCVSSSRMRAR
jgi:hypothetical protein